MKLKTLDQVNAAGWPRPRMESARNGIMPAPWIAEIDYKGRVDPRRFNRDRLNEMEREWLCQVCGRPCGEEAWAAVVSEDFHTDRTHEYADEVDGDIYEISGGPVCSERCARLAIVFCPHLKDGARLIRFYHSDTIFGYPGEGMMGTSVVVKAWVVVK